MMGVFMITISAWIGFRHGLWRWEVIALGVLFVVTSFAKASKTL